MLIGGSIRGFKGIQLTISLIGLNVFIFCTFSVSPPLSSLPPFWHFSGLRERSHSLLQFPCNGISCKETNRRFLCEGSASCLNRGQICECAVLLELRFNQQDLWPNRKMCCPLFQLRANCFHSWQPFSLTRTHNHNYTEM